MGALVRERPTLYTQIPQLDNSRLALHGRPLRRLTHAHARKRVKGFKSTIGLLCCYRTSHSPQGADSSSCVKKSAEKFGGFGENVYLCGRKFDLVTNLRDYEDKTETERAFPRY